MTKTDRVRELLKTDMGNKEIADIIGTSANYVKNLRIDIKGGGGTTQRFRKDVKNYKLRNTKIRNKQRRGNYGRGAKFNHNSHRRYIPEEDCLIKGDFKGADRELAQSIGRTVQAVQVRRSLLKG